ncbi:MAG: YceI family protein [Tenacibaculum sp.]
MKTLAFSLSIYIITFLAISCKKESKQEQQPKTKTSVEQKTVPFSLKNAKNLINWTAFKTTEKIPVKGQFKKVNIILGGEGNTAKEAINNTEFSIPVSSIFTQDNSRDYKIKKFFFGVMDKTELLSGNLVLENDSVGYSLISMNGVIKKLNFNYSLKNKAFNLKANMKISDWKAEKALESLNTACKDLHKGSDGISKAWDEVIIEVSSTFK